MHGISPDLDLFVQAEVASGRFATRDDVIMHALRMFQSDRDEAVQGILAGLEDVAAGRMQPLSEAFADLRRELACDDAR